MVFKMKQLALFCVYSQRSLEVATALVTGEGFRRRMLQHVGLQRPFTRTGVVATLMGTVLQLKSPPINQHPSINTHQSIHYFY